MIKTYHRKCGEMIECEGGFWVNTEDHLETVKSLEARIEELETLLSEANSDVDYWRDNSYD